MIYVRHARMCKQCSAKYMYGNVEASVIACKLRHSARLTVNSSNMTSADTSAYKCNFWHGTWRYQCYVYMGTPQQ